MDNHLSGVILTNVAFIGNTSNLGGGMFNWNGNVLGINRNAAGRSATSRKTDGQKDKALETFTKARQFAEALFKD